MTYKTFLESKSQLGGETGFKPHSIPDFLFDFQKALVEWAIEKGRCAIFADCGLGKTPMQLVFADNVVRETNKPFLILCPLAVAGQTVREAEKFGIEAFHSKDGQFNGSKIVVANYERLHKFNWQDFTGALGDESSILKNYDGVTKQAVTDFMHKLRYRALFTATAAPNDYIELGTSSEALGELGYIDMLKMFFKSESGTFAQGGSGGIGGRRHAGRDKLFGGKFRFRGHAEHNFWRWVCSWSRALRKPSDMGFSDERFKLPPLVIEEHVVKSKTVNPDFLFDMPAITLAEQRSERRRTLEERCEVAAQLANQHKGATVSWCSLNDEGDMLEKLIKNCVQVSGNDSIEQKEEAMEAFQTGKIKKMVTKGEIAGFGVNWQHCDHQTYFPSHSFEQYYQQVRRSWRFGQKKKVTIDIVTSEGEQRVISNLHRKATAAEKMFDNLVRLMNDELKIKTIDGFTQKQKSPLWLSTK